MIEKNEQKRECPEFKPEFFWAFAALLLYKTGGIEIISQAVLEKFPIEELPEVLYEHDKKAWIMKLKGGKAPTIVTVPKKLLRKTRKL